jgi:hypothetical protein
VNATLTTVGDFEPAVILTGRNFRQWVQQRLSFRVLKGAFDELGRALQQASGRRWACVTVYVLDECGAPVLSLLVEEDGIHLWDVHGWYLEKVESLSDASIAAFQDLISQLSQGRKRCQECRRWVSADGQALHRAALRDDWPEGFEYAAWVRVGPNRYHSHGFVCDACYDQGKHLPPSDDDFQNERMMDYRTCAKCGNPYHDPLCTMGGYCLNCWNSSGSDDPSDHDDDILS